MEDDSPAGTHAAARDLAEGAIRSGITLTAQQFAAFEAYIATLLFWRTRLSLTGAATPVDIVRAHILDSLAVVEHVPARSILVDLGSGAGFPGVPLAIARPHASITLVESRRKRANFLREVVRRSQLANTSVVEGRAEELSARAAGTFDVVVSRAVWSVPELLPVAAELLRSGGLAIAMKGPKGMREARPSPGFRTPETVTYKLHAGIERMLLIFRKV